MICSPVGPEHRLPRVVDARHRRFEAARQAEPGAGRDHERAAAWQPPVGEGLHEALAEADLRSDRRQPEFQVGAEHVAAFGVEDVVARVADERPEDRRQPHLREQPVDQQLVLLGNLLVEQLGVFVGVAAERDDAVRKALGVLRAPAAAIEVE